MTIFARDRWWPYPVLKADERNGMHFRIRLTRFRHGNPRRHEIFSENQESFV